MSFPQTRLRRLRQSPAFRNLVREGSLSPQHLVLPFFVRPGKGVKRPIASMPGQYQWSRDLLLKEVKSARSLGISAVLLFGIPSRKDETGSEAYAADGVIQAAVRDVKQKFPDMVVAADLCFCEYTSHGHCGVVRRSGRSGFELDNDATLDLIARTAAAQAEAGADVIAPSGMADGMVAAARRALDENGFGDRVILAYSAKYASSFYGPFRDAAESPPLFGDRRTYQMDPANAAEALRETALDLEEGADIVMVKPALAYLDVIRRIKEKFQAPLAAYNVSGEYAMVKAAADKGWIDEEKTVLEIANAIKRAGADILISYHARDIAKALAALV